jgi:hypothetical protein
LKSPKQQKRKQRKSKAFAQSLVRGNVLSGGFSPMSVASTFPSRMCTQMTYAEVLKIGSDNATGGKTGTAKTYQLNSLYQPRVGGHQPYGFDILSGLYNRYFVRAVHLDMTIARDNASTTNQLMIAYSSLQSAAGGYDIGSVVDAYSEIGEKPGSRAYLITVGGGGDFRNVNSNIKLHEIEGITESVYLANDNYRSAINTSPSLIPTLQLAVSSITATTTVYLDFRVRLTFDVEFYDRIVQVQS